MWPYLSPLLLWSLTYLILAENARWTPFSHWELRLLQLHAAAHAFRGCAVHTLRHIIPWSAPRQQAPRKSEQMYDYISCTKSVKRWDVDDVRIKTPMTAQESNMTKYKLIIIHHLAHLAPLYKPPAAYFHAKHPTRFSQDRWQQIHQTLGFCQLWRPCVDTKFCKWRQNHILELSTA